MAGTIYQLKITLLGVAPPVWRRILVPGSMRLSKLHKVIQAAMGWTNTHLYQFEVDGGYWGDRNLDDPDIMDATRVTVRQVLPYETVKIDYTYDFGDNWRHRIVVEKILPGPLALPLPFCTGGRRACPPEDVGGIYQYETFLEAMRNPDHPEHDELSEWVGGEFDPEHFDPVATNDALEGLSSSKRPRKTSRR